MPRTDAAVPKRALGRIQRLCCLGIGGEMLVPELMRELDALIPTQWGAFRWLGPDLEITNAYSRSPASIHLLYLEEFADRRVWEVCRTPREMLHIRSASNVIDFMQQALSVDRRTYLRSDFYNLIMRPSGADECRFLSVREPGRVLAELCLGRAMQDAPFAAGDDRLLNSIAGFISHGMMRAPANDEAFAESDDRALFIAHRDGRVRHASIRARQLLLMALVPRLSPTASRRALADPVPETAQLCRLLRATADGEIGQAPPVLRRRNAWGEFVLRAYWLGPTDGAEPTGQIGITIERRVPRALALWRRVEQLPLTGREKQLCLLLGHDPARDDLAEAMGLAASTVVTHQRSIYAKLGMHSRAELIAALQPVSA